MTTKQEISVNHKTPFVNCVTWLNASDVGSEANTLQLAKF